MSGPAADVAVDRALVARLLRDQHPDLAGLDLEEVGTGWDNVLFRIGDALAARLPRRTVAAPLVAHEQRWLPVLAPRLTLAVPVPVRVGHPSPDYPWSWSIVPWFAGAPAAMAAWPDDRRAHLAARRLGRFVRCLHLPAPPDAPRNPHRGIPLAARRAITEAQLDRLGSSLLERHPALRSTFDRLAAAPPHTGPPRWLHGDLHPGNVLVGTGPDDEGTVVAVLDFGDVCAGDPATDLAIAWMAFDEPARAVFLQEAGARDDATVARARAWAIALAVAYLDGAADDASFTALAHRTLRAAVA